MSKSQHAASLADAIIHCTRKALEDESLDSNSSEDSVGHNFIFQGISAENCLKFAVQLITVIIRDIGGNLEAVYTSPRDEKLPVSFKPPYKNMALMDVFETASNSKFVDTDFPVDPNTQMLLDVLYATYLKKVVTQPMIIDSFPAVMARMDEDNDATKRFDIAALGYRLASVRTVIVEDEPRSYFLLCSNDLAMLMAGMRDTDSLNFLPKEWKGLNEFSMENVPDLLDSVMRSLNAKWDDVRNKKNGMTQRKMIYLMNPIGGDVVAFVREKLLSACTPTVDTTQSHVGLPGVASTNNLESSVGARRGSFSAAAVAWQNKREKLDPSSWELNEPVFTSDYHASRRVFQAAVKITEKWLKICELLSTVYWKDEWEGKPHVDVAVRGFSSRLEDIIRLRATHEQLHALLAKNELHDMAGSGAWRSFVGMDVLQYSAFTVEDWKAAIASFDKKIEPLEQRIALKLRNILAGTTESRGAMLAEMTRFQDLIKRRGVAEELNAERDTLAGHFKDMVNEIRIEFRDLSQDRSERGRASLNLFCTQARQKITSLSTSASALLGTSEMLNAIVKTSKKFCEETDALAAENFQAFEEKVKETLSKGVKDPIILSMRGSVFGAANEPRARLYVRVSPILLTVMKDVRQMQACGMNVDRHLLEECLQCLRFYKQGCALKRVASMWNMVPAQVLKSQKVLLAAQCNDFEELVSKKGDRYVIDWKSYSQAETFLVSLRTTLQNFFTENRKLRRLHQGFSEKVVSLYEVPLLTHLDKWKSIIAEMKKQFDTLEGAFEKDRKENKKDIQAKVFLWKIHWDIQIYKALEHQFQLGLETLNETLDDIHVDIIYRNATCQFSPSYEEIRSIYHGKIMEFLVIPEAFTGLTDVPLFEKVLPSNKKAVQAV